jgi:hypothetical protein
MVLALKDSVISPGFNEIPNTFRQERNQFLIKTVQAGVWVVDVPNLSDNVAKR